MITVMWDPTNVTQRKYCMATCHYIILAICFVLQHLWDIPHFTASGPCSKVTVSLWAEHFPFVANVIWMTTKLYFRLIHKYCSRTDRQYYRSLVHKAVTMNTAVTALLQHIVVLWLKGIIINQLQMLKVNLLSKSSGQKNKPYCCYLQIRQAGSSATSVSIYQHHSVFWQKNLVALLRLLQQ